MSSFILVTGGYDTAIRFFDATNQRFLRLIQFNNQQVLRIAFSGTGAVSSNERLYIIAGGSPNVTVYDVSTPEISQQTFSTYKGHTEAITAVGFEPTHTAFVYSASEDGTLQIWIPELSQRVQPAAYAGYQPAVPSHLPDHPFYQYPGFRPSKFVNTADGSLVMIHDAKYYAPNRLFFIVDAKGRLRIWSYSTSSIYGDLVPHRSKRNLQCLELSFDNTTLVTANFDGYVFVYDVETMLKCPNTAAGLTFRLNDSYIPRVRLSQNAQRLVCTTKSGAIKIFRMDDLLACRHDDRPAGEEHSVSPYREFTRHPGWVWDAAFVEDRDDYLFTCSSNTQVMMWALDDMNNNAEYTGHTKAVVCLAVRERYTARPEPQYTEYSESNGQVDIPNEGDGHAMADMNHSDVQHDDGIPQYPAEENHDRPHVQA